MKKENKKFLIFIAIYIFIFLIINIIPTKKTTKNLEKITPEKLSKIIKKERSRLKLLPRIFGAIPLDIIGDYAEINYFPDLNLNEIYTNGNDTNDGETSHFYISPAKEKINMYFDLNEEFIVGNKYFKIHTTKKEMINDAEVVKESPKIDTKENLEIIQIDFKDEIQSIYVYENKLYGFKYEKKTFKLNDNRYDAYMIVYDISNLKNIKKITNLKFKNSKYIDWFRSYIYKENIYFLEQIPFGKDENEFKDGILLKDYTINGKEEKITGDNIYLNPDKNFNGCFKIIKFNMNEQKEDSCIFLSNLMWNLDIEKNKLKMHSIFSINNRNFRYYLKDRIFNPFGLINDKDGEKNNFKIACYDFDLENFNLNETNISTIDEFENRKITPFEMFKYFGRIRKSFKYDKLMLKNIENGEKYLKFAERNPKIFPVQKVKKIGKDKIFTYSIKKPKKLKDNVYELYLNLFETKDNDFSLIDQKKFYIQKKIDKKNDKSERIPEYKDYDEYKEYDEDQYITDALSDINVDVVDNYIFLSIFDLFEYEESVISRKIKLDFKNNRTSESFSIETDKDEISVLVFEVNGNKIKPRTYLTEKIKEEKYNNENEEFNEEEYEREDEHPCNIIFKDGKVFFRNNKKIIVLDIKDLKIYNYNL